MRSPSRAALTMLVTLSTALSLSIGPVAHAQDATPGDTPTPTPSPFCAVLSAAEVSTALGITVTIDTSSDTDCTYADYVNTFTSFNVNIDPNTDYATVVPLMIADADGTDIQIGGHNARVRNDGSQLYLDTPHGLLGLLLFGQLAEGIDPAAVMQALAGTVLSRLDAIPLPTPEPVVTPGPEPSFVGDADLMALFPATLGGEPLQLSSRNGAEILAGIDATDESQQAAVQAIQALLASAGKTTDDLSLGTAFNQNGGIEAFRVKGADMTQLEQGFLPIFTNSMSEVQQSTAQVAGKTVTTITSASQTIYAYPKNDVLWIVFAEEPNLTEAFQTLP